MMIEIENLFSLVELSLNFCDNYKNDDDYDDNNDEKKPLKDCLMQNYREKLALLAQENLNCILNYKLKLEYKISKNLVNNEEINLEKFLSLNNLNLKLLKRMQRLNLEVRKKEEVVVKEKIFFKNILKLIKKFLFAYQILNENLLKGNDDGKCLLDLLDRFSSYLNDYLVLMDNVNFVDDGKSMDDGDCNINNNARYFDETKFCKSLKESKRLKNGFFNSNLCNFGVFLIGLLASGYLFLKFLNSGNDKIDFKNLVGVTVPYDFFDSVFSVFKSKKQEDFEDVVLVHKKINDIIDINSIKSQLGVDDGVSDSEVFWFTVYEYLSNGYLIMFTFVFYCIVQISIGKFCF
jgi:hypothetical protein